MSNFWSGVYRYVLLRLFVLEIISSLRFDRNFTWVGEKIRQQSIDCLLCISITLKHGCFAVTEKQINTSQNTYGLNL